MCAHFLHTGYKNGVGVHSATKNAFEPFVSVLVTVSVAVNFSVYLIVRLGMLLITKLARPNRRGATHWASSPMMSTSIGSLDELSSSLSWSKSLRRARGVTSTLLFAREIRGVTSQLRTTGMSYLSYGWTGVGW